MDRTCRLFLKSFLEKKISNYFRITVNGAPVKATGRHDIFSVYIDKPSNCKEIQTDMLDAANIFFTLDERIFV